MRNVIIAISFLAFTAAASAAEQAHDARPLPVGLALSQNVFADPNQIAQILQNEGYVAKVDVDSEGDPKINSSSQRAKWGIYFYGCTNHTNCQSIQFHTSFTTQGKIYLDQINTWNRTQRFACALLDKDGDSTLKMDVQLISGISVDTFKRNIGVWDSQLGEFEKLIGW
jgi:Putative bacterial sensory transduction regulator